MIPVVLFCYNRPLHTRQVLEALQQNPEAPATDLWIFSDGPKAGQEGKVQEVRTLLSGVVGFRKVKVIQRSENLGLSRNIRSGIGEVMEEAPGVIVLEDDLKPTRNFLAYMNAAMTAFRKDSKVHSVGAYLLPQAGIPGSSELPDIFAASRFSCWGWGIWKERWDCMDWTVPSRTAFFRDKAFSAFHRAGNDLPEMMLDLMDGKNNSWAVLAAWHVVKNNLLCLYPGSSKVSNIGFDGTGVHSHDLPGRREILDDGTAEEFRLETLKNDPRADLVVKGFRNSPVRKLKNLLAYGRWF